MELNLPEELTQPLFCFKTISLPGNINAFDISPVILIVGVDDIASLNVAVIVTTFELYTKLSESESVRDTVGDVLSWF